MGDMKSKPLKMGRAISKKKFTTTKFYQMGQNSPYYRLMVDTIDEVGPGVKPPSLMR